MKRWLLPLLCALSLLSPLGANVQANEAAPLAANEAVEKRLLAISEELRCLVCQNETLAASQAELANDLRREIRGLINEGKSDAEIMDFMVSRYGDFVRYRPPVKSTTLLLWFGPVLLLLIGLLALFRTLRQRNRLIARDTLSADEAQRANALLNAAPTTPANAPAPHESAGPTP
ncbi:cytochrome c-type biogenesis protein CcmH [Rhodocyclus tenuis]|uniref:Cytochrome c-type biogenesis protein n=2 Tax=Rhodocyclus TaxID=1064 RepID=A0A6L5JXP0_RHOTE|nr:cytochrome c-type biogenesis protein [Rhodocyclus gracilis]MQY51404.1 cytochrome c-type biogenesis protein CcmH [Rhodocyclus gracilis]MRD72146.1 cytochrome c-type biogenesis protein CcmH [Rhodocyclus gracilis]NJA89252.1 cytochrome c-type biogenesis protein CcmH [Rhodocyclus gracilis]